MKRARTIEFVSNLHSWGEVTDCLINEDPDSVAGIETELDLVLRTGAGRDGTGVLSVSFGPAEARAHAILLGDGGFAWNAERNHRSIGNLVRVFWQAIRENHGYVGAVSIAFGCKKAVRIARDGSLEYLEGYRPTDEANMVWKAIGDGRVRWCP